MSEVDELKYSVDKEVEDCKRFLKQVKDINDLVPHVQERRREAEAKQLALSKMPDDVISEYAQRLLPIQLNDQRNLESRLPTLPDIDDLNVLLASEGTTSAFYEVVVTTAHYTGDSPTWIQPVVQAFDSLAQEKAKKVDLPVALEKLQPGLGEAFKVTVESVEMAKSYILGVDQAAIRLRDVIEQLWGGLAERARQRCPREVGGQRLALKKQANRTAVANCLASPQQDKALVMLLDNISSLASDLSEICKDPLANDLLRLNELYSRWLLQTEDLRGLLAL